MSNIKKLKKILRMKIYLIKIWVKDGLASTFSDASEWVTKGFVNNELEAKKICNKKGYEYDEIHYYSDHYNINDEVEYWIEHEKIVGVIEGVSQINNCYQYNIGNRLVLHQDIERRH